MDRYMGIDALAVKMCGKQIPDDALAELANLTARAKGSAKQDAAGASGVLRAIS